MERSERQACLRVLLAVARADGVVEDEEEQTLALVADEIGASSPPGGTFDLESELRRLQSAEARARVLSAAHAVANVDGCCTPQEYRMLERIHAVLGVGAPGLEVQEQEWSSRMGHARDGIARATADFLLAVASLGDDSGRAYEGLVQELDASKRRVLGEAMGVRGVR